MGWQRDEGSQQQKPYKMHVQESTCHTGPKFKREATFWRRRAKGNEAEKRRHSRTSFSFLVRLCIHSFEFLLNYF